MAQIYIKTSEALGYFPVLTENTKNQSKVEGIFKQFLFDASRLIETDTNAPVDFYAKSTGGFSVKQLFYKGTQYLRTYPFTEIEYIRNEENEDIEDYRILENKRTIFLDTVHCHWLNLRYNDIINISAKWGFECVPEDIKVAVKSKAILLMQNAPTSRLDIELSLDEEFVESLEKAYDNVVDRYSHRNRFIKL